MIDEISGITGDNLQDSGEHDTMRRVRPIPHWKKDSDSSQDVGECYASERSALIAKLRSQSNNVSPAAIASVSVVPVNFLISGTYGGWIYMDSDGAAVETVVLHQIANLWARCSTDRICDLCRYGQWWDKKHPGFTDKWRYKSAAKSLCIFAIDTTTASNPNIKTGEPAILLGPPVLELKIKELINRSSDEEMMLDFDPAAASPLWEIRKTKDSLEINRSRVIKARPPLPDTFPVLKSFRGIDAPPSEETVKEFKEKIDAAYSGYLNYSDPPR
jgi:hypothetical protein